MLNPFRVLGVYANSKRQEILANKSKATAFLNVNKPVEFPLDLKGILPSLNRTLNLMNEAEAHLAIAKERIKYAQFWFLQKMSPLDDIAFNHLLAGNMAGAIEIWSKQDSLSSLQNRLVCYLIENKLEVAIKTAEKLYEKFGNDYISKVDANSTLQMTATDLLHQFVDSLGEEIGMQKLLDFDLGAETKEYISSQTIGPLVNKISSEVDKTKSVDHKNPKARLEAARELVANTKEAFSQLKNILPATDSRYQIIADKLGLEILQCGIDYFNNSKDDGRHQTAMKMQKYALSIVVGTLAKQRCEENVRILQDLIDKLPPEEIKKEHDNLQEIIALFILLPIDVDAVLKFLKDTCSDLVSIKEKLGKNNPFYIQQATLVAQIALSKSIDALNEAQEVELPKLNGINRDNAIKTMKHVFAVSWEIMLQIELIDADSDFKTNRLKPNKTALKNILDQVDAFKETSTFVRMLGGSYSVFEGCAKSVKVDVYQYYTESEMYSICTSVSSCQCYLKKYPQGKHANDVRTKLICMQDDADFRKAITLSDYKKYLTAYPKGRHVDEVRKRIGEIEARHKKILSEIDHLQTFSDAIAYYTRCKEEKYRILLDDKCFELCERKADFRKYLELFGSKAKHKVEAEDHLKFDRVKEYMNKHRGLAVLVLIILVAILCVGIIWGLSGYSKMLFVIGGIAGLIAFGSLQSKDDSGCLVFIVAGIIAAVCIAGGNGINGCVERNEEKEQAAQRELAEQQAERSDYESLKFSPTTDKCSSFLRNHPRSAHYEEVLEIYYYCAQGNIMSLNKLAEEYGRTKWGTRASERVGQLCDSLYQIAERTQTIAGWRDYQAAVPNNFYADSNEKIKEIENEAWNTEAKAWRQASNENTLAAYRKYLSMYPNGSHKNAADKKVIDLEVQAVASSGDYGYLPPSQKLSYGTSRTSNVFIKNSSSSTITILYSGANSRRIILSPHQSQTVSLPSGSYRVVATAPGVRSFYGTENLTGGDYSSEYYITTTRY